MKSFKALLSSLLLASGLLVSLAASADTIVDVVNSLTGAGSPAVTTTDVDPISMTKWVAQAFTTPADHFKITDVALQLWNPTGATGSYDVSFWNDNGAGGTPGAKVADVAVAAAVSALATNPLGVIQFNALSIGLTEATNYFLVVSSTNISALTALSWGETSSSTFVGHSSDGFTTSVTSGVPGTWVASSTAGAQQMQIQADIPEPASLALFTIGLVGMRFSRRKAV